MPEIPDLSGVVFSAAIDSDGRLGPVAGLEDKLRAMVHGHVARPHTLVVAQSQWLGPEWDDYRVEHAGLRLIKADNLDEALALVANRQGALRLVETTADSQLPPLPGTRIPRPWLFEQLDEALGQLAKQAPAGQLPRGYVVLEAPAGSGKSQLLAEYVRREQARGLDRDCLAWHFIRRHESGRDDQHRFLRQLARQICLHRGLPVPDAESELRQSPAVELQDSLSKAAIELKRPMVVVIDALDEAFGQGSAAPQADLGHLLPTGDALPAGVILLVSTRPGEAYLDSFPRGPRVTLSMDTPAAVKDVQAYIDSVDAKYTLGLEPTLKQQLAARCGANLMLATSLLQRASSRDANERARWQADLEAWRRDPSSIPDEPLRYLNQEWQRLGQASAARGMNLPPAEAPLAVLALLGLFRYAVRPLARTELTALLGTLQEDEGPLGVQAPEWLGQYRRLKAWLSLPLLDDLLALASVFLDQPAGRDGAAPGYRIANATFSDYVDARLTEQGWEKDLHSLLGFGASFWANPRHGEWLRHYAVAALPHHLYQAGQAKLTEQVLTDPPYLQAVYDALGDGALPTLEEYLEQLIIDDDPDIRTDRLDNVWGVLAYHHRMLAKGHMWVAAALYNDLGGLDDPNAPWFSPPPPDPKRPALIRGTPGRPGSFQTEAAPAKDCCCLTPCQQYIFTYCTLTGVLRQYRFSTTGRRLIETANFSIGLQAVSTLRVDSDETSLSLLMVDDTHGHLFHISRGQLHQKASIRMPIGQPADISVSDATEENDEAITLSDNLYDQLTAYSDLIRIDGNRYFFLKSGDRYAVGAIFDQTGNILETLAFRATSGRRLLFSSAGYDAYGRVLKLACVTTNDNRMTEDWGLKPKRYIITEIQTGDHGTRSYRSSFDALDLAITFDRHSSIRPGQHVLAIEKEPESLMLASLDKGCVTQLADPSKDVRLAGHDYDLNSKGFTPWIFCQHQGYFVRSLTSLLYFRAINDEHEETKLAGYRAFTFPGTFTPSEIRALSIGSSLRIAGIQFYGHGSNSAVTLSEAAECEEAPPLPLRERTGLYPQIPPIDGTFFYFTCNKQPDEEEDISLIRAVRGNEMVILSFKLIEILQELEISTEASLVLLQADILKCFATDTIRLFLVVGSKGTGWLLSCCLPLQKATTGLPETVAWNLAFTARKILGAMYLNAESDSDYTYCVFVVPDDIDCSERWLEQPIMECKLVNEARNRPIITETVDIAAFSTRLARGDGSLLLVNEKEGHASLVSKNGITKLGNLAVDYDRFGVRLSIAIDSVKNQNIIFINDQKREISEHTYSEDEQSFEVTKRVEFDTHLFLGYSVASLCDIGNALDKSISLLVFRSENHITLIDKESLLPLSTIRFATRNIETFYIDRAAGKLWVLLRENDISRDNNGDTVQWVSLSLI